MPGRHYTEDERQAGFVAIVLAHDNCSKASRDLKAAGIEIPRDTLSRWRNEYPDEIEAVRILKAPELEEKQARMAETVATAAAEATLHLVDRTLATADDLSPKDVAGAARNMATVYGIATEKGLLHRQKPTSITAHDYSAAIKGLERMGIVEGEAEEVPDAVEIKELKAA